MLYFILLLFILIPALHRNQDRERFLEPSVTASVNGFFVLLVFYRHVLSYRALDSMVTIPMNWIDRFSGQLIVVPFLFFSGYGVMESVRRKGEEYLHQIPGRRILRTWIRFVIAVIPYLIIELSAGIRYSAGDLVKIFLGWESAGNSNWYIFVILMLYLITFLAAMEARRQANKSAVDFGSRLVFLQFCMTAVMILILLPWKEAYWYNTVMAYPVGMWYSGRRDKLESLLDGTVTAALPWTGRQIAAAALIPLWCILIPFRSVPAAAEAAAILFCATLVLVLRFVEMRSRILLWLGRHLFGMYMGQRLVMILLCESELSDLLYLLICGIGMLAVGWILDVGSAKLADRLTTRL